MQAFIRLVLNRDYYSLLLKTRSNTSLAKETFMKRFVSLSFLSLVLGVFLPVPQADSEELRVGFTAPLSGPFAHFGTAAQNGFLMAKKENPEHFQQIRFFFEDDGYDPKRSISAFHKLRQSDQVDIIYIAGVPTSEAVIPLAEQYAFPLLVDCQRPDAALGTRYTIRTVNYTGEYTRVLLEHLRSQGFSRFGIIASDAPYIQGYLDSIREQLEGEEKLEPLITISNPAEQDFRTPIARLRRANIDALGILLFPGQISSFYRQARTMGLDIPSFGTDIFESTGEISDAAGTMQGAVYAFNQVDLDFAKRYRTRFGNDEHLGTAASGYAIALMLAQRFSDFHPSSSDEIIARLKSTPPAETALGKMTFKESATGGPYFHFPVVIREVRENHIATLE